MTSDAGPFSWGRFGDAFLDELATILAGRRVLEVFAGNGLLASRLAARGTDVLATSVPSDHDRHERGMHHPVVDMDAVTAVVRHGRDRDVLLMSWPTTTPAAARCALAWGEGRPVVFVGEVSRPPRDPRGRLALGGCADDAFFALMGDVATIGSYDGRNLLDTAFHAVVRWPTDGFAAEVDWSRFWPADRPSHHDVVGPTSPGPS